ncbi:MAG: hypothetical protein HC896_12825 [Bacteroidales bacterium]|nr:hypothetical protein [Bacteroidales bacterium]
MNVDVLKISYVDDFQDIVIPDPALWKSRMLSIQGLIFPDGSYPSDFRRGYDALTGLDYPDDVIAYRSLVIISDGTQWIITQAQVQACPSMYINGKKAGILLKNSFTEKRKKEDTMNIGEMLNIGENIVSIVQDEYEIAYFNTIKTRINGVENIIVSETLVLNKEEKYTFLINKTNIADTVEVTVNGYYELSEDGKKKATI